MAPGGAKARTAPAPGTRISAPMTTIATVIPRTASTRPTPSEGSSTQSLPKRTGPESFDHPAQGSKKGCTLVRGQRQRQQAGVGDQPASACRSKGAPPGPSGERGVRAERRERRRAGGQGQAQVGALVRLDADSTLHLLQTQEVDGGDAHGRGSRGPFHPESRC